MQQVHTYDQDGNYTGFTYIVEGAELNTSAATDKAPPAHDQSADDLRWDGKAWQLDVGAKTRRADDLEKQEAEERKKAIAEQEAALLQKKKEAYASREITMRQGRLQLLKQGLLDSVQKAIDSMPEPQKTAANIEWEYSSALKRNNPFVLQLGAALGLDEAKIDFLFDEAAKL